MQDISKGVIFILLLALPKWVIGAGRITAWSVQASGRVSPASVKAWIYPVSSHRDVGLPGGVTVAQEILVLLVQVRILAG